MKILNLQGIHAVTFYFVSPEVTINGQILNRVGHKLSEMSTKLHDKTKILGPGRHFDIQTSGQISQQQI